MRLRLIALGSLVALSLLLEACDSCGNSTLRNDQHDAGRRVFAAGKQQAASGSTSTQSGLAILQTPAALQLMVGQGNDFSDIDAAPRFTDSSLGAVPASSQPAGQAVLSSNRPLVWAASPTASAVFVFDSNNNNLVAHVSVGSGPARIRISPDARSVYVTNSLSDSISVISTKTFQSTGTISLPAGSRPTGLAVTPDGTRLWVVSSTQNSVLIIDPAAKNVVATVPTGLGATFVAITPDGALAYVANASAGSISVIDTLTNQLVKTVTGIPLATAIAFDARGSAVFVVSATAPTGTLFVLKTDDYSVTQKITVGNTPVHVARDTFGSVIYTVNQGSGDVTVIDGAFLSVIGSIPIGGSPAALVSTP